MCSLRRGRPERRRSFSSKLFLPVPGRAHRLSQIYSCEYLFVDFETASPTERSRLRVRPDANYTSRGLFQMTIVQMEARNLEVLRVGRLITEP